MLWAAIGATVAWYVWRNVGQLREYGHGFDFRFVALSIVFAMLAYLLNIQVWTRIANHCGAHASWSEHARAWSISRLGRYVPGKVATIYLRLERYPDTHKISAGVSLYVEIMSSLIAICVFTVFFSARGALPVDLVWVALLGVGLAALAMLSSRRFLDFASNRFPVLRKLRPPSRKGGAGLWMTIIPLQMGVMVLHGTSLYFAISAISEAPAAAIVEITVYYYFAGLAGMLALFAPAGIGVREAVLAGLLRTLIPLPAAVVTVALIRLVTVVAELGISAIFYRLAPSRASP
ncbi:lysylphosphatidylglycerol synthase domain-containing protein [Lysobacter sp. TLK-CK17T]|uniref:Lysylphosphatidylglycerol synthase domain-containing protein n=2 Tax=Marilutibacter chinensis TaxID=2912247 RepID=A0ABS9HUJ5_9GAMM|nr:lysylphosphatidylglycerol synthase domain-containing protein [Lysobacter chinensis]